MQQQEPNGLTPAQRELEEALRTLAPAPANVDAVAAAFSAGRNSAHRQVRVWQAAAALLLAIGTSAWFLPHRPGGAAQPRDIGGSMLVAQSQPAPAPAPPPQSLLMLQRAIWQQGLDDLPATQLPATESTQLKDTL